MKKLLMLLCAFAAGVAMGEQVEFRDYDADTGAISPAEFERIDIVDGVAYLGVSVYTNSEVKVEGEGWGVATNGVIEVPAPGKQGFFILKSKPSAPSDASHSPITILE